jgi:hypothetical protein
MRIEIGLPVDCSDGRCGVVADVVIDPLRRTITHLVVEPRRHHHLARLVPTDEIDGAAREDSVRLRCSGEELRRLPTVEERAYLRVDEWPPFDGDRDVGLVTVLSPPFYDGAGYDGAGLGRGTYVPMPSCDRMLVAYDRIPAHEVEVRRASPVETADEKKLGHVDGFVVDEEWHVTHLVVERRRLWRYRELTVPARVIKRISTDRVALALTADQVAGLPVDGGHGDRGGRQPLRRFVHG